MKAAYIWFTNNRAYYVINKDKTSKYQKDDETGLKEIKNIELIRYYMIVIRTTHENIYLKVQPAEKSNKIH